MKFRKKKLWNQNQFLFGEEILNLLYYFKQVVLFSSLDNLTRELSQIIVTNKKNVVNDFFSNYENILGEREGGW